MKLCRQEVEVIQNREDEQVCNMGPGEAGHRKYEMLEFGRDQTYGCSSD